MYAAFERFYTSPGGIDPHSDIVLVRDDNGGLNSFANLGMGGVGNNLATDIVVPYDVTRLGMCSKRREARQ